MNIQWYQWYIEVIKKYTVFSGRASRSEFWFFMLMSNITTIALFIIDAVLHTSGVLVILYDLFIIIPALAVTVRRLHDIGKSGWWTLIYWIPALVSGILYAGMLYGTKVTKIQFGYAIIFLIIGFTVLIVFEATDSQPGTNRFGENPKGVNSVKVENANDNTKNLNQNYKFCTKCGYKNDISANYCKQCGEKLS